MKQLAFLFLVITLFSCGSKEEEPVVIPQSVLTKEKMTAVLVDVHLVEAGLNLNVMSPQNATTTYTSNVSIDILKKHQITKPQYDSSFVFYTQHPEMLSKIYEDVLNELSKLQAKVANEK